MEIGLCMVVKNEAAQLASCLDPLVDLLDDIAIVDTGSEDGTLELLRSRYRLEPLRQTLDPSSCYCLKRPRELGLRHLHSPWVLFLDADERLDPDVLRSLQRREHDPTVAGYFGRWINHVHGQPAFDDYKLFLFRAGLAPLGLVHDNVQLDIRRRGEHAQWLDGLVVEHYPDAARAPLKRRNYRRRLDCAIAAQPHFLRYYWFRGYMNFLGGRRAEARRDLSALVENPSEQFPVECLNSAMVLAELTAAAGDKAATEATLESGREFLERVRDDFEVRINCGLPDWLATAQRLAQTSRLDAIQAPRFAC